MAITSDHAIVDGIPHVYQFPASNVNQSLYRCVAFTLAALIYFATRGKYPNLNDEAHTIYSEYAGPDVRSNENGLTIEQAKDCLSKNGVGYIDMQHFIDAKDWEGLRHEMACQNRQGIPQLMTVADESHMIYAKTRQKLHNWNDSGLSHCFARLGMMEHQPIGFYLDPAAPCPPFDFPTPIQWGDIETCGILHVLAIMPHAVGVPPADFRFFAGKNEDGTDRMNHWPLPKPVVNVDQARSTLESVRASHQQAMQQLQVEQQRMAAEDAGFVNALRELGANV